VHCIPEANSVIYDFLVIFVIFNVGCSYCGLQRTCSPLVSQPYSGTTSSYDDSLAAAEEQENFEYIRSVDEFSEAGRERQRDRDRVRDRDANRDWDQSHRHRSGDR